MSRWEDITVDTLVDYISNVALKRGTKYLSRTVNYLPIYRGQANKQWSIVPSVYRYDRFKNESNYIREMGRVSPEAFSGLTHIEALIKMQHFGLPTRLLDFTTNALTALYFACCNEFDKDGVVYEIHAMPLYPQDFIWISIVTEYIFELSKMPLKSSEFIEILKSKGMTCSNYFIEDIYNDDSIKKILTSTHGIYPKFTNTRQKCQDGVFLLFGMDIMGITDGGYVFDVKGYQNIREIWEESRTVTIPHSKKISILSELDAIGINYRKLFPGLDSDAKYALEFIDRQNL